MKLSLRGDNMIERLALRAGRVPAPAAEAWAGMALSGVLVAATRLGLTDRLAVEPSTAIELSADLLIDLTATQLLLDCLQSTGHVTCRKGRYALSRASRPWLDPRSEVSIARFISGNGDYWTWWADLPEITRSGKPLGHHDAPPDDLYWRRYVAGQFELARLGAPEVVRKLPMTREPRSLLDIGGGHGWYSAQLCRRHSRLVATVLDLPGSAKIGRELISEAGFADRVSHVEGDARTADLGHGYDIVFCFNLVHHLRPEEIVNLFTRVHAALAPGGSFAVMDALATPTNRKTAAATFLGMFMYLSSGACTYTQAELRGWLHAAGFPKPRRTPMRHIPGQTLFQVTKEG